MKSKIKVLCILMAFLLTMLPISVFAEDTEAGAMQEIIEQNPAPMPEPVPEPESEPEQEPSPEPAPTASVGSTDSGNPESMDQEPEDDKVPESGEESGDATEGEDADESEVSEKDEEENRNDAADDSENGDAEELDAEYNEIPTFVLNTPDNLHVTFGVVTQSIGFVSVSDVKGLREGERIMLHISDPTFVNINDLSQTIPLSITDAGGNDTVCLGGYDIPEQPVELFLHISAAAWQQAASGSYAASISYLAVVE